jgi:hypothetical protein
MTLFAAFLAEYRAQPPVKHALANDPQSPVAKHYFSVAGLLEQIELGGVPCAAALCEPAQKILAQKALSPAARIDCLFRFIQIRDRALLGLGQR